MGPFVLNYSFTHIRPTGTPSIKTIVLEKENASDKFGFSVSDSVNDKGVYIKNIEEGSLAYKNGRVQKYDRILKVWTCFCFPLQ